MSATLNTRLSLDTLEAREMPVIAIEYLFITPSFTTVVTTGKQFTNAPASPFAGVKVNLGPAQSVGALVGWPPITVGK